MFIQYTEYGTDGRIQLVNAAHIIRLTANTMVLSNGQTVRLDDASAIHLWDVLLQEERES